MFRFRRCVSWVFGFGLTVIIIPNSYQDINAGRWAWGFLVIPILLILKWREQRYEWIGLAFLGLVVLSLLWTSSLLNGYGGSLRWALLAGCFVAGRDGRAREIFRGASIGIAASSALVIPEYFFGWHWFNASETGHPAGLFGNRNFLAEAALLIVIPSIWSRSFYRGGLCAPSLALTDSRSAVISAGIVALTAIWRRSALVSVSIACIVVLGVVWASGSISKQHSMENRLAIWQDTADGLTWTGRGVGSFYATFPEHATRSLKVGPALIRTEHAHNDWLEIAYEFGLVGLALALLFAWRVIQGPVNEWSLVFLAFCVESCFDYALWNAGTAILGALAAGAVFHRRDVAKRIDRRRTIDAARRALQSDAYEGRKDRRQPGPVRPAVPARAGGVSHA